MPILPDLLAAGLKVIFCGTAVGDTSAAAGAYYADTARNTFWSVLYRIGLTPRLLRPDEFHDLLQYGIGLTDLVKARSGGDKTLHAADFGVTELQQKIHQYAPKTLAFNGKKAANTYFGRDAAYGRQPEMIARTVVFVLPSTSGAARGSWDEAYWRELAAFVR